MKLSTGYIDKIIELNKQVYGVELARDEAYSQGQALLGLVKAVYRPIPKDFTPKKRGV